MYKSLDDLIQTTDVQTDDLLDLEFIVMQARNNQPIMAKFILRLIENPQHLLKMIDYILIVDDLETDHKKAAKFPFVSSEILAIENEQIIDFFVGNEVSLDSNSYQGQFQFLDKLFHLLSSNADIQSTTISYFCKLIINILKLRPAALWKYLAIHPNCLNVLMSQISHFNMIEVIYSICVFQTSDNHKPFIQERKQFFKQIMQCKQENAYEIIKMTLECLNEIQLKSDWDQKSELVSLLYDEIEMERYLSETFENRNNAICLIILQYLIREKKVKSLQIENDKFEKYQIPISGMEDKIISNFSKIVAILQEDSEIRLLIRDYNFSFQSTFGVEQKVFGQVKLNLLHVLHTIADNKKSVQFMVQLRFVSLLLKLLSKYNWNNQLHLIIESLMIKIIKSADIDSLKQLFQEERLHEQIMSLVEEEKEVPGLLKNACLKGYRGHLNRVQNEINSVLKDYPELKVIIDEYLPWANYNSTKLISNNELNVQYLLGIVPEKGAQFHFENELDQFEQKQINLDGPAAQNQGDDGLENQDI